jgi:hypothetical protein
VAVPPDIRLYSIDDGERHGVRARFGRPCLVD